MSNPKRFLSTIGSLFLGVALAVLAMLVFSGHTSSLAAPSATTWFVDGSSGLDANDCMTTGTACKTVGAAVSKAVSGDTIQIASGVYTENLNLQNLTLVGAGMDSTFLDGSHATRVLTTTLAVTLSNLSVRNGAISGGGGLFAISGGGVFNFGTLTLESARVYSNTAEGSAGGIFNSGTLILHNSQVISNTTDGAGGGIYSWSTGVVVTATSSLIAGNVSMQGGGIDSNTDLALIDTTVSGNTGTQFGGGLYLHSDMTRLERVTISANRTTTGSGGGIYNTGSKLTMINSTISGNKATSYVGLANIGAGSVAEIFNSTVAFNTKSAGGTSAGGLANFNGAVLTITNSIVANNDSRQCTIAGGWTSKGYNLSSDLYCNFTQTGDQQNAAPLMGPLGDYGGATLVHPLLLSSPAVDAADNSACPASDQRGVARPFDGDGDSSAVCDIGAFEARNQIAIQNVSLFEGDSGTSNAVFTMTLAPTSTVPITVNFATQDGTALASSDYTATNGLLVFSPLQTTRFITISVRGDTDDEATETFYVNLSNAQGADLSYPKAEGEIIDDDGLSSLSINDVAVNEGDAGSVNAVFEVTLSPAAIQVVTVTYTTTNVTALAGSDYGAASGDLVFTPGQTTKPVTVTVYGDTIDEGASETYFVNLSNAINANIGDSQGLGTITDDEVASLSLGASVQVSETDSLTSAVFTVTLSTATGFTVTVDYATSDGNGATGAVAGSDYQAASGTLTFSPGQVVKFINVPIYGDIFKEEDENFNIEISNPSPVAIYINIAGGTILNDDSDYVIMLPLVMK